MSRANRLARGSPSGEADLAPALRLPLPLADIKSVRIVVIDGSAA